MPLVRTVVGIARPRALVLVFGAMLGKMLDESGAALATAGTLGPLAHAGAGGPTFPHVNDAAFWMFRQCFNFTVRQTATWGVIELIVALAGLGAALLSQLVL